MRALFISLMTVVVVAAACGGATQTATVSPSPVLTTSTPHVAAPDYTPFSFRIVLSGPAAASAAQDIAYVLEYQRVSPPPGAGNGIVIIYNEVMGARPAQPAATLVSVKASLGAPPADGGPQISGFSENYGLSGDSGTLQVVVRPAAEFSGPLTIGFYVRGTGIQLPAGSVDHVTTLVGP